MSRYIRSGRPWWRRFGRTSATAVALIAILGLTVLWIKAPDLYRNSGPGPAAQATATTRAGILALLAAAIATFGAAASLVETRRANRASDLRNHEAHVTDRYIRAVSQLGESEDAKVDVRIGGVYVLQRIAEDSGRDRPAIIKVLSAFIRRRAPEPGRAPADLREYRPPADVQAAADALSSLNRLEGDGSEPIDLSEVHLEGVRLRGRSLSDATMFEVHLEHADLRDADLRGTHLKGARLEYANLTHADLRGAVLRFARLDRARLHEADLARADLHGAHLVNASLRGANFENADLSKAILTDAVFAGGLRPGSRAGWVRTEPARLANARLQGASLAGANVCGVDLSTAKGLSQYQLDQSIGDHMTQLPPGLQRPASWAGETAPGPHSRPV